MKHRWLSLALFCIGCGGGGNKVVIPPPPVLDTFRTIQGKVSYFTSGPDLNNRDANGRLLPVLGFAEPTFPRGAARLDVDVLRPDGTLLGSAVTDEDGDFSVFVNFGPIPATQVRLRVRASALLPFGTVLRVLPSAAAAEPYTLVSSLGGTPAQNPMTVNFTFGVAEGSGAFHVMETLRKGLEVAKSGLLDPTLPNLDVLWAPGNGALSRFENGRLVVAGGIAGDEASNRDEWDPHQLMRLLGLYLQAYFFHETAPPGVPTAGRVVPSLAWKEGFLDFWACVAIGSNEFWDTEGTGASGRVIRFFHPESFFDPALGPVGPDDPNVYQSPADVGIGSPQSVTEILWDLVDSDSFGDQDGYEFPLFLLLRACAEANPGESYPYVLTVFDELTSDGSLTPVKVFLLLAMPEAQGIGYPASEADGSLWPPRFATDAQPTGPIAAPYDRTLDDAVDTLSPTPPDFELGILSQRYFRFDLASAATATLTLTSGGDLRVDLLDATNALLATGETEVVVPDLLPGIYIARVRPGSNPQSSAFQLRLRLTP